MADSDILRSEREHHKKYRVIYRSVLGVVLVPIIIGLIWAGFNASVRTGWMMAIGVVVVAAVLTVLGIKTSRGGDHMLTSPGPWSWGQVYSGDNPKRIWNSMGKVLVKHQMSFHRLTDTTAMAERPGTFLYRKGVHLMDVQPSTDYPGWTVITVFSTPDMATTLTDFGRGATINQYLLSAVPNFRRPSEVAEEPQR